MRAGVRALGLLSVLIMALARPAQANTCAPATSQGAAPSDYQNYCWLDFSGYSDAQAQAGGQPFNFTLPDGSMLSLTLNVTTNGLSPALNAHVVPSWTGAAIGHTGFNGIPGNPVLYEPQNGSTVNVVLNNITITPPPGSGAIATYAIIAADGESTNQGESLQFTTNGGPWAQVAQIPFGANYPAVSGLGSATVTETGVAGNVGAFAFASFNNPTVVSATLVGGGLQGALFAVRYASVAVTAQFNGARANAADQFTYSIKTPGGTTLASGTSTGNGAGPFPIASLATIAAGYPFVVTEVPAAGSVSPVTDYAVSLTCTNQTTGTSSTALPNNQAVSTYTFPTLHYGDAINCVFTDTANRANLSVAKTGPATVSAGGTVKYTLTVSDQGPLGASGALVQDPAVANFTATSVVCTAAAGGAVCPSNAQMTIANLQGTGIAIPTLPNGGTVSFVVSGTAGVGNITNLASIGAPPGVINSNPTPTSTAATTVTPAADVAVALTFPASVNAGQPVAGTVLYTNNGPSTASGTTFSLTLTANLAAPPTLSGLPAGATYGYVPATGVITLIGMPATLASGASLGPIGVSYTQPASATSTVSASINSTTTDPNPANNSATLTIGGAMLADVAAKVNFPASVNAGQPVAGTVLYTSNGPSTASGTTFSLTVAANLAAPPTLGGLPAGATYSYVPATGVITLAGMPATLASGASLGPISVSYTQPPSGTSTVTASINSTTTDPNPANNSATAVISGSSFADVATSLTFPSTVNAGQTVAGTVLYTNNGPGTASSTVFSLTVAADLTAPPALSGLPAGATYSYVPATGVITLTGMPATLATGASVGPISVSYTQPGSATSTVSASINSTTTDPNPANNRATVTIAGAAVADVGAKLTFPAHANAGQPVAGTVLYTNNGPSTASGTTFSLTLAANLAALPTLTGLPAGATYSYVPATGIISLAGMPSTLAAGASLSPISVSYTQPGSATSTVSAAISSTTLDPNTVNNSAAVTITGIAVADVATRLTFPAHANAGQPVAGTVRYTNSGPSMASGTTFSLEVAPGLTTPPTLSGLPAGAAYSYVPATGVITLTGMPTTLASGASIGPISVSYTQPLSGTSTVHASIGTTTSISDPGDNGATVTITGAAASLMGTVFIDNNQDGVFDSGDTVLAGATVQLLEGTRVVASAVTNAAGVYNFTGPSTGHYSVAVVASPGYLSDTPSPVAVTLGGTADVVNFGLVRSSADGALVLSKTTPLVNVSAGQSVPYTITARNPRNTPIVSATLTDLMPPGFRFRTGSGSINGKRLDPTVNGRELTWSRLSFAPGETKTFTLVLTIGAGVGASDYVNQATAYNGLTHQLISNVASATVRIVGDPTFDCPDLIGKVFDDANANGVQDAGEKGIAGVRLVTAQGLLVTTDAQGRYHIACPVIPNADSGSNFVLKVDERTLPSGYRLTTDNPETVRLTAGKVSKLDFGATIHHVVRIEVNAAAYEGGALRASVTERLDALVESLKDQASIVRLAYQAGSESDALVGEHMQVLKSAVTALWKAKNCRFPLRMEEDIVRLPHAPDAAGASP